MNLLLETDRSGQWIARQSGMSFGRLLIGVPLLLFGLLLLYGVVSSPIITLSEKGAAGIGNAILGSLVLLLFTAFTLPLGWWICFSRHLVRLDNVAGEIVEISDWRLGGKRKATPVNRFHSVRLAVEELSSSNRARGNRHARVQMIRLLAKEPDDTPSIEIGWSDGASRESAEQMAGEIARHLGLRLHVIPGGDPVPTPAEIQMNLDDDDEEGKPLT